MNDKTKICAESHFEAMGFAPSELDYFDERMLDAVVFLTDVGMEVVSCRLSGVVNHAPRPGHIAFVYDPYTKNIFDLMEIPLTEVDMGDEFLLIYRFANDLEMVEHIQRIEKLFRKYQ